MNRMSRVALSPVIAATFALLLAPITAADPTAHLQSQIGAARSESGCPPYQLDPVLNDISQAIAHQVNDFVGFKVGTPLPTTGEIDLQPTGSGGLLKALNERGYNTNRAKLLNGYGDYRTGGPGDNEEKAVRMAVLQGQGFDVLSDCAGYTKYGLSALNNDASQGSPSIPPRAFSVAVVIVAG